ncbi:MAG: hypothetical protein J5602_07415, partial [Clostridia bacterium]|nr:hypothetical protein [Clostridia bacterium]
MKTRTLANKILSLLCAIAVLMSSVPGLAENLDLAQQAPSSGSAVFGVAVAAGRQTDFSYEDEGEYASVAIAGTYRGKPAPSVRDALVDADLTVLETWTVEGLKDDACLTLTASVLNLPEDNAPLSFYTLIGDELGEEIQGELAVDDEITIDLTADGVTGVAVVKGEAPVKEDDATSPVGDAAVTVETSATETTVSLNIEGMDVLAAYNITVTPSVVEPEPSIPTKLNAAKTQSALNTRSTASQTQSTGLTKGQTDAQTDATRGGDSQTETTGNQVRFYNEAFAEAKSISVYRMGESESDLELVADNLKAEDGWVSFEADSSSVYVIAGVIEKEVEINGSTYRISVAYDSRAGIPDGAELAVSEVDASAYLSDTAEALKWADDATVYYAKFLDISIEKDGVTIEPGTPVSVTVTLLDVEKG